MIKGSTKVMVGKNGIPRIQEELGDSVKVYSLEQWNEELKRREIEDLAKIKAEEKVEEAKEEKREDGEANTIKLSDEEELEETEEVPEAKIPEAPVVGAEEVNEEAKAEVEEEEVKPKHKKSIKRK